MSINVHREQEKLTAKQKQNKKMKNRLIEQM